MCDIDFDPCDVWRETRRKARKQHTCDCCGGTILPGTHYVSHFSLFEGDTTSEKICAACDADRDVFGKEHGTYPCPSYFPEVLTECIADGDEESEKVWKPMLAALRLRKGIE
jgi:hypothetical protein